MLRGPRLVFSLPVVTPSPSAFAWPPACVGLPLLRETGYGLAVLTTFTCGRSHLDNVFYDVAKNAVCRLVTALADETKEYLAVLCVSPGWMDVERMTGRAATGRDGVGYLHRPWGGRARLQPCGVSDLVHAGTSAAPGDVYFLDDLNSLSTGVWNTIACRMK